MAQLSFSTIWTGFASNDAAKLARNAVWKELRKQGFEAKRWVLHNQLRKYESFGVSDGRSCDVYMGGWVPVDALVQELGIEKSHIATTLSKLKREGGHVENGQRGYWRAKPTA